MHGTTVKKIIYNNKKPGCGNIYISTDNKVEESLTSWATIGFSPRI